MRHVATPAGVRRYNRPIGSPLGGGGPVARSQKAVALWGKGEKAVGTFGMPWPQRGGLVKDVKLYGTTQYDRPGLVKALRDRAQHERMFDPRDITYSSQPMVTNQGVRHYLHNTTGELFGDTTKAGNKEPVVFHDLDTGTNTLLSGHHRMTASLLQGRKRKVLYYEGRRTPLNPVQSDREKGLAVTVTTVVDLTRHVRTPAGVKRYGKPIGSPLGGGKAAAVKKAVHAAKTMSSADAKAISTHEHAAGSDAYKARLAKADAAYKASKNAPAPKTDAMEKARLQKRAEVAITSTRPRGKAGDPAIETQGEARARLARERAQAVEKPTGYAPPNSAVNTSGLKPKAKTAEAVAERDAVKPRGIPPEDKVTVARGITHKDAALRVADTADSVNFDDKPQANKFWMKLAKSNEVIAKVIAPIKNAVGKIRSDYKKESARGEKLSMGAVIHKFVEHAMALAVSGGIAFVLEHLAKPETVDMVMRAIGG